MKLRMVESVNSILIVTDNETYPFIRSVVLAYCDNNLIPQNPLLAERVTEMCGKPGINDDGLPPRLSNEIEVFLRDAGLKPDKVAEELKNIIRSLETDIKIL